MYLSNKRSLNVLICAEHVMQLIYFSSGEIPDFEFRPPVMDWTRGFSVAF